VITTIYLLTTPQCTQLFVDERHSCDKPAAAAAADAGEMK